MHLLNVERERSESLRCWVAYPLSVSSFASWCHVTALQVDLHQPAPMYRQLNDTTTDLAQWPLHAFRGYVVRKLVCIAHLGLKLVTCATTDILLQELIELRRNPPPGCSAGPIGDDLHRWQAAIFGPEDTPYEHGIFSLSMIFPEKYPLEPPKVEFITTVRHPNVNTGGTSGDICLDVLKDRWSPSLTIANGAYPVDSGISSSNPRFVLLVLLSIRSLLAEGYTTSEEIEAARRFTAKYVFKHIWRNVFKL
ncbi:ubiquitin-conjugating enzyme/RWD-like protein [Hygrophoropsis aurantiaca]|uniref:Ubiquitin-conjugating enzyme/RWD-like protein n=1 Tax=Hygrophoropsis aurantiaca TaxID=72124 RepID=A0ACB8A0X6_9AGAM|nr:ubiquitin-conjugating enzyme/RWD-like protein [Hygrophoropsis aurantiaca]